MYLRKHIAAALAIAFFFCVARGTGAAQDLQETLHKLDVAASNFRTTSADFQFDSYLTDPIPDKDTQKGTVYYERKGSNFRMAAHIEEVNGKPVPKVYAYANGTFQLDEPLIDQVTTFKRAGKFESYVMLGFGASGKALAEKWDITDRGAETLDGVKTERLELVAKDPAIKKSLPKVTIWMDVDRAVSLKQVFEETDGQSRVCVYFNIKVNKPLPSDAFKLKTTSKTHFIER